MIDIRSFTRGIEYNETEHLNSVKIVDDIVTDMCPLNDKFKEKYKKYSMANNIVIKKSEFKCFFFPVQIFFINHYFLRFSHW